MNEAAWCGCGEQGVGAASKVAVDRCAAAQADSIAAIRANLNWFSKRASETSCWCWTICLSDFLERCGRSMTGIRAWYGLVEPARVGRNLHLPSPAPGAAGWPANVIGKHRVGKSQIGIASSKWGSDRKSHDLDRNWLCTTYCSHWSHCHPSGSLLASNVSFSNLSAFSRLRSGVDTSPAHENRRSEDALVAGKHNTLRAAKAM